MNLLLVVAMLASSAVVSQPSTADAFELDSFRWRAAMTPQRIVVAGNEWGDLRVRTTERDTLEVSAMVQNIGAAREFDIRIEEGRRRVVVTVVPLVRQPKGRVDLTLLVPAGKRLEATTRDGLAEIKYQGPIRVRTRSGPISIDTPSQATARSESGNITAKVTGNGSGKPLSLRSGSGDVTVWLPQNAGFTVRARGRGEIAIGFPHDGARRRGSSLAATIGDGESQLCVETGSGRIRVQPYGMAASF